MYIWSLKKQVYSYFITEKYFLNRFNLINIDGKATTQVLESIEIKSFMFW